MAANFKRHQPRLREGSDPHADARVVTRQELVEELWPA
jgi:hypothetical protein